MLPRVTLTCRIDTLLYLCLLCICICFVIVFYCSFICNYNLSTIDYCFTVVIGVTVTVVSVVLVVVYCCV